MAFGSKAIITGDLTQKDLPSGTRSGLDDALHVLKNIDEIGVCNLTSKDVVRHPLVQKIVTAYDEYDKRKKQDKRESREQQESRRKMTFEIENVYPEVILPDYETVIKM